MGFSENLTGSIIKSITFKDGEIIDSQIEYYRAIGEKTEKDFLTVTEYNSLQNGEVVVRERNDNIILLVELSAYFNQSFAELNNNE